MFCTKCGEKLLDQAKFCTSCGALVEKGVVAAPAEESTVAAPADEGIAIAPVEATSEVKRKQEPACSVAVAQPAASEAAIEAPASFKAAMDSSKQKSKRRIPLVLLVALVTLLLSGVAYAAYRVYTDIVVPQIQSTQQAESRAAEGTGEPAPEAEGVAEATDAPTSVFQIANILAMSPQDISEFVISQGLQLKDIPEGGEYPEYPTPPMANGPSSGACSYWSLPVGDTSAFTAFDPEGTFFDVSAIDTDRQQYGIALAVGDSIGSFWHGVAGTPKYATTSTLQSGETPSSIALTNLPFRKLDEATMQTFTEACGLGTPLATYEYTSPAGDPDTQPRSISTGSIQVHEQPVFWYVTQGTIGCYPEQSAEAAVVETALYSQEEWDAADQKTRALIFAQSLMQDNTTGNGSLRTNILTGEQEMSSSIDGNPSSTTHIWETAEEYKARTGKDVQVSADGSIWHN